MKPIIDIHCHPSMKPFGFSFDDCKQSINQQDMWCMWHDSHEGIKEAFIKEATGIAPFRQSDFNTLDKGNVKIVCCTLYPLEKGFFVESKSALKEWLKKVVTALSTKRISNIRSHKNYFDNLTKEYKYLTDLNGQMVSFDGQPHFYRLATGWKQIKTFIDQPPAHTIISIFAIEGAHVFNTGLNAGLEGGNTPMADREEVLKNVNEVKQWEFRPLFMTFAHHFYNELCGHARSLGKFVGADQEWGLDTDFTPLGFEVCDRLLDNTDGTRIYIDIKHMSRASRKTYLNLLKNKYKGEDIPVIVSHGAVTGLKNESGEETIKGASDFFRTNDINLYDDEIIEVGRTKGMFGLQLDERRIASAESLNSLNTADPPASPQDWAKLLWRQIQHIGQVLDTEGLPAWDITTLGTDFDGVIKPMGNYLTAEELPMLEDKVLFHAKKFMENNSLKVPLNKNASAEEIIDKVFRGNALRFLEQYFKEKQAAPSQPTPGAIA